MSMFTSSSVMLEYSSPSGMGPSGAGGEEAAPLNGLPLPVPLDEADASWGVSFEHMVPSTFEAPEYALQKKRGEATLQHHLRRELFTSNCTASESDGHVASASAAGSRQQAADIFRTHDQTRPRKKVGRQPAQPTCRQRLVHSRGMKQQLTLLPGRITTSNAKVGGVGT